MHDVELARNARALDFHWRVSDNLIAAAGLPKFSRSKINRAMASVLAALALASDSDRPYVSYSRSRDFYAAQGRYEGTDYTYASVLQSVDELGRLGLIEEIRSRPGAHLTHGMQSRIKASDRLVEILAGQPVEYLGSRCPLVLKGEDGSRIDYEDTAETRGLRREICSLNRFMNSFTIDVSASASPDNWERTEHHIRARKVKNGVETWACVRVTPKVDVYRVFSRGGFRQGGRIYGGFWEGLPKDRRLDLMINGEVVIEEDFASLHPRLLYALRGERMAAGFDCYALPHYERWVGKLALNVAINAATLNAAAGALMEKGRLKKADGSPVWPYGWAETRCIIDKVIAHNPAIAGYIGSDAGVSLMAIDARIALDVLKSCEKAHLAALPVHDSFLAPDGRQADLKGIMNDVLEGTLNRISPATSVRSRKDSMGETIQMIRYREPGVAEAVEAPVAEPEVAPAEEPASSSSEPVVSPSGTEVRFRPVLGLLPSRPGSPRPRVVVPTAEPGALSPVPLAPAAPPSVVPVPPFLLALRPLPEPIPTPSPEPPPVPVVSRHRRSLAFLAPSLPPADVPADLAPLRPAVFPPRPALVSLAIVDDGCPEDAPEVPPPSVERVGLLGRLAAQARAMRDPAVLAAGDARMAELRALASRQRAYQVTS